MEMIKKNLVLIGIIVCVVLAATWYGLASRGGDEAAIAVSEQGGLLVAKSGDTEAGGDPDVLKLLLDMRAIKLDDRLFKSAAFRVLQDTGKEIITEPKGRANPFAPTGSDGVLDESGNEEVTSGDDESGAVPQKQIKTLPQGKKRPPVRAPAPQE
jgi:hypothetical protein